MPDKQHGDSITTKVDIINQGETAIIVDVLGDHVHQTTGFTFSVGPDQNNVNLPANMPSAITLTFNTTVPALADFGTYNTTVDALDSATLALLATLTVTQLNVVAGAPDVTIRAITVT